MARLIALMSLCRPKDIGRADVSSLVLFSMLFIVLFMVLFMVLFIVLFMVLFIVLFMVLDVSQFAASGYRTAQPAQH